MGTGSHALFRGGCSKTHLYNAVQIHPTGASALNSFMYDQVRLDQILSALQAALQPIQPPNVDAIDDFLR